MNPKKVPAIMNNYDLSKTIQVKTGLWTSVKKFLPLLREQKGQIILATLAAFITSGLNLLAPVLMGHAVDNYIQKGQFQGVLVYAAIILAMYVGSVIASYFQTLLMGRVGQNVLFTLRNAIFNKLGELPVAFFNQNKAGDLISRINNDTDKLNQFFSQSLVQMTGNLFMMTGATIFLLALNVRLGLGALAPAAGVLIFTQLISGWIKRKNLKSLQSLGGMSAEIQESLANFKVIVAFNRLDYFRQKFNEANERNFEASVSTGIANGIFVPIYGLALNVAQLIVLAYGV